MLKRAWLSQHNMKEVDGSQNKKPKNNESMTSLFRHDIRMSAMAVASDIWKDAWNQKGMPLDCQLKAGMALREEFELHNENERERKTRVEAHSLGQGGVPP